MWDKLLVGTREDLEIWYDYGINPRTRTLYLGGRAAHDEGDEYGFGDPGIYWNTARRLIKGLHYLDATKRDDLPITIIMNSCEVLGVASTPSEPSCNEDL